MSPRKKTKDFDNELTSDATNQESLALVKEILENTQANIKRALDMLKEKQVDPSALLESLRQTNAVSAGLSQEQNGKERIVEGVFNGERMVGPDGVEYNIPANYASKSKLVEGDILKLTISADGSFIYKQIGPIDRRQLVATLAKDSTTGDWYAIEEHKRWKLLTASVTYFHGGPGDEVVILIPKDGVSSWAAVENVIRSSR